MAYWVRTNPHCHEGNEDEFTCPFCSTLATGRGMHMQLYCIILPILSMWSFANIANRLAIQDHSIEWHSPLLFIASKNDEEHSWGLILDFLLESHDQWSPLNVCITWSSIILQSKGSPLTIDEAINVSSQYLNSLGVKRTWPPLVHREYLPAEPNPQGWPMHKALWNHCVIATAFTFVGR